jgi:50S ribosomal protein L16 3-hydroxylase
MLYLPPLWAHDGVAEGGDCMTASVGFRAPAPSELARELLMRLGEEVEPGSDEPLYRDAGQAATDHPGEIPAALQRFAAQALHTALRDPQALPRALGEWLSEPKPQVWFEPPPHPATLQGTLRLDRRTRMLYDARHVFVNGESFRIAGRDARLLRQLADRRVLEPAAVSRLSLQARETMSEWLAVGWLEVD